MRCLRSWSACRLIRAGHIVPDYLEFVGQSSQDPANVAGNPSRLINLYPEPVIGGGIAQKVLKPCYGRKAYKTLSDSPVRAMEYCEGSVYAACDGGLYEVGERRLADIRDDVATSMVAVSGAQPRDVSVGVVAGRKYFLWRNGDLTEPAGGAFDRFGSIEYIAGRMVLTEKDGRRFLWSNSFAPDVLEGDNFATTERGSDNNLRALRVGSNLWIFKERSIEIWYQTGTTFLPVPGGLIETGLMSAKLLCRVEGGAFFIGDDGIAYLTLGDGLRPISTPGVHYAIDQCKPRSVFYYEARGHKFCVLTFDDCPAWVFDIATAEWHERSGDAQHGPLGIFSTTKDDTGWLAGEITGSVSRFTPELKDNGAPIRRTAISRSLFRDSPFRIMGAEFIVNTGRSETSKPVEMWARMSPDGGHTWSEQIHAQIGSRGQFGRRAWFPQLGWYEQQATMEINITDDVESPIMNSAMVRIV